MRLVSLGCLALLLSSAHLPPAHAAATTTVVIGDSLSAEYEAVPEIPGIENPTRYASITVPGWESMSWVEVLGHLRPESFRFGAYRPDLIGWQDLRFSGYELNFAIPGFETGQYEEIVNSSLFSHPEYWVFRSTLAQAVRQADGVVVWLGANDFRANFGALYDGEDPAGLIATVRHNLDEVLDFVQSQNPRARVVLANIPDLSVTPTKQTDHPDPLRQARVTEATRRANESLATLAAARGVEIADVFTQSQRLHTGERTWIGPVEVLPGMHPDNHPLFHFTRDGLHPNTAPQIEIAQIILQAFNRTAAQSVPVIANPEALALLGISPDYPYHLWAAAFAPADLSMTADPDHDHLPNLVEYAFGLRPLLPDPNPLHLQRETDRAVATCQPDPSRVRHVRIAAEISPDLRTWSPLPEAASHTLPDGRLALTLPAGHPSHFLRARVEIIPP